MFVSLGLKNAWRNRGRTALGIASMSIAAIIFLSSTTLSQGYPAMAFMPARQLLGGDIVLLPGKLALSQEDMAGGYVWRFARRSLDRPNLVMGFDTEPYSYGAMQGFLVSGGLEVTGSRYQEVLTELQGEPSVRGAEIRRALPFLARAGESYVYGFLDARNVAEDLSDRDMQSVVRGSYLDEQGEGLLCVAVSGWASLPQPPTGSAIVEIPRFEDGHLDYERPVKASLTLTGVASFVEGSGSNTRTLSAPAVFVSPSTLGLLAAAAGYPDEATYWGISVTLEDMSVAENVAALLRREFTDFTVVLASQLTASATGQAGVPTGVPMDMRRITEAIAFITAALLSDPNLTVLMLSRKNEIGILRALGGTKWNIACMVLTESVSISLLGALTGGAVTQPAILWQLLSNRLGQDAVLRQVAIGLGKSAGFAVAAATLFGFLPVARALRITPAQVLRGE